MGSARHLLIAVCFLVVLLVPAFPQGLAGREDIWADFSRSDLQGIRAMHAAGACDYVDREVDGVRCVATDGVSGKHWLCFDVPREFITSAQPTRYTLIIRYLDAPADGLVTVRYHAARDAMAQAIRFQRQGSGEWRELVLPLADAVFMNGTMACADFAVHGFTDTGDPRAADVFVSGVWLSKRIIEVSADPGAIATGTDPAQQTCTVRALVYSGTGALAPDGTVIRFSATGGTIGEEAKTENGVARATFTSDGAPGTAVVSADWDVVSGWATVAKVAGDQPLREGRWVGSHLDDPPPGDLERVNAATSFADLAEPDDAPSGSCLQVHYCFQVGAPGQPYVTCPLALPVPGRPKCISLSARGDGSPHHFQLILEDARGTMYTVMAADRLLRPGWQQLTLPVDSYDDCWGPDADGVMDFPVTIVGARWVCLGGAPLEGDIYLDEIGAEGLFPTDALAVAAPPEVGPAAAGRTPDGLLAPVPREPLGYITENLVAMTDAAQLSREVGKLYATPVGRDPEAIVGYRRLLELMPNDDYGHFLLAELLFRAKDFTGALAEADKALRTQGFHTNWARLCRARILDELGRRDEASKEYAALAEALPATNPNTQTFHWPGVVSVWTEACRQAVDEPLPFHKRAPNASPEYREITDLSRWTVRSSRTAELGKYAIDRNAATFWAIGGDQETGDWLMLDLGEIVLDAARLVLDDDGGTNIYPWDMPGEMRIEGSADGEKWEELGVAAGNPRTVIDVTWEPRPLRFLRATLTEKSPKRSFVEWRAYEAYVYVRE